MADGLDDAYASGAFAAIKPAGGGPPVSPDLDEDFSRFYLEQAPNVRAFLLRRRMSPQAADDLVQEVFIRAYRAFALFEKRGIPQAEAAWVSKIALRLWYNAHRDSRGEPLLLVDDGDPEHPFDLPDPKAVDSRQKAIDGELLARIPVYLRQLPEGQRQVLALWLEGKSYEEIVRLTGKQLQNVRATLHKAKAKLGESLRQLDGPPARAEGELH